MSNINRLVYEACEGGVCPLPGPKTTKDPSVLSKGIGSVDREEKYKDLRFINNNSPYGLDSVSPSSSKSDSSKSINTSDMQFGKFSQTKDPMVLTSPKLEDKPKLGAEITGKLFTGKSEEKPEGAMQYGSTEFAGKPLESANK